ncbi:MAG: hypothetical protein HZB99_04755 [Candidatus Harrisonbacteria bacterium]|nr:hypothetical protein [Candidatus Harrisonbacteria bacterium]
MPEKIKQIIRKVGILAMFVAASYILTLAPNFYWYSSSGLWNGRQAVCGTAEEIDYFYDKNLREVILNTGTEYDYLQVYDNKWPVKVSGKLSYSPGQEIFYLRDGIFSLPLNVSNCQNIQSFEKGEKLIAVKGIVSEDGDKLLISVTELRETVPGWVQIIYNAGIWGGIILVSFVIFSGFSAFFRRFLVRIGLIKLKPAILPEAIQEKNAVNMFVAGIAAIYIWVLNPVIGAGLQIFSLIFYRDGLRSKKRSIAIAGAVLCGAGFIAMLIEGISLGRFEKPYANFYSDDKSGGSLVKTIVPTRE